MLNFNNAVVHNTTVITLNDTGAEGTFLHEYFNVFARKKNTHLNFYSITTSPGRSHFVSLLRI